MSAADFEAVANCVIAASAAVGLIAWLWRARERVGLWYRRKKRENVLNIALPLSVATLVAAILIIRSDLKEQRKESS